MTDYEKFESERRVIAVAEVKRLMKSRWAPEIDTHERAVFRADVAIELFSDSGEPAHVQLGDIVTDLIHWAHVHDVDWQAVLDQAEFMMNEDRADWGMSRLAHA